jgi:hypothetical protein
LSPWLASLHCHFCTFSLIISHTFSPATSSINLNSFRAFTDPFSFVDFFNLTYFGIILSPVIPDRFLHGSMKRTLPLPIFTILH